MKVTEILVESRMGELHSEFADVYHKLTPKIERHKDAAGAEQLYQALKAVAVENNAVAIFKDMLNAARNAAHMDYDTNPGGFENWFWYLPFDDDLTEGSSDIRKKISKFEELALAANRAGDDEKCKFYQQKIQTLKQKMSQGVTEAKFTSQFKTKQEAVQYAKEKVKIFRDPEDGIEVWAMPDSGFNVVHTMNYSGRESVMALGGRKLGTVGPRWSGVAEGEITRTATGLIHRGTKGYGADYEPDYGTDLALSKQKHHADLNRVNKPKLRSLEKSMGIDFKNDTQDVEGDIGPSEQEMNQSISDLVKDAIGTRPTSDWMQRWMDMNADKKLALYQQLASQLD
jgi:hypothetical protein